MREALAKALYESWCDGRERGTVRRSVFYRYPWEEFKTIPIEETHVGEIYQKADLLLGGFGSVDIVFEGTHVEGEPLTFVEVESPPGTSIKIGDWVRRTDGYHALRIPIQDGHEIQDAPDDAIGCLVCWECRTVLYAEKGRSIWFADGCPTCGKWGLVIPILKIPVPVPIDPESMKCRCGHGWSMHGWARRTEATPCNDCGCGDFRPLAPPE